jgi:hypothetical protein
VIHPDCLGEVLAEYQLKDWREYYERKPFGPHVTTYMLAQAASSMSGEKVSVLMPRLEPNLEAMDDDEKVKALPGGDGAKEYLESLNGNR